MPPAELRLHRPSGTLRRRSSASSATDIRFSVSVPVLSVHNTVAEPSVSIAAARRVSTRALEMRHAPIAMNTVNTTGNSSGSIDMPSAMPARIASSQPPRERAVQQYRKNADGTADDREHANQAAGLRLQPRRFGFERPQRETDLADLASRARRGDFTCRSSAHDERAGEHVRQIVAARPLCGSHRSSRIAGRAFAHRHGFTGQQRLVGLQVVALHEHRIGRHAVAFRKHDYVTAHDIASGDTFALPVAHHECARTGQVAQRFQNLFGPRLLHDRDRD